MDFKEIVEDFRNQKILIIGDLMVDKYIRGNVDRISPEAPVQIVDVKEEDSVPGGMGNTVRNLRALDTQVSVLSVVGDDSFGRWLYHEFEKLDLNTNGILTSETRSTTVKTRIVAADHHQLLRYDRETRKPIDTRTQMQLIEIIKDRIMTASCVLISDYGKGVITQDVLNTAIFEAHSYKIPVIVDPKGGDFSKYESATFITPNRKEASIASGVNIINEYTSEQAAYILITNHKLDGMLITHGEEGVGLFLNKNIHGAGRIEISSQFIPAQAREVYDVTGAGDTVLAVFGLAIASGAKPYDAACLANFAAGIVVGKVGTSSVTKEELLKIL